MNGGSAGRILIVDGEASERRSIADLLSREGYTTQAAADGFKALGKLSHFPADLVVADVHTPGTGGIDLARRIRSANDNPEVIVVAHAGEVETAVAAMQAGALTYLKKPLNSHELLPVVRQAVERRRLKRDAEELRGRPEVRLEQFVGASPDVMEVFRTIALVARSNATVLVTGASGTGKELVASAIHRRSARAEEPFVKLHCAALAGGVLESELFGHERGAFTGAERRREGRFETANGGTLFLDEISEIPLATQVKLLRVLQEREFERVGGNETIPVDVRVIAASNRDLEHMVAAGKFREDLYYRLNVVRIRLPTLRERLSDIPLLVEHFLRKHAAKNGKRVEAVADDALALLLAYQWPGNVRELENLVERAVVLCAGNTLMPRDFPREVVDPQRSDGPPPIPGATISELERHAILETLRACDGSTIRAARILGISARKIQYKLHEYVKTTNTRLELQSR